MRAWRLQLRAAEFAADHLGGTRQGAFLSLPGIRPVKLERRVVDVYAECAAEQAGRHPRLVQRGDGKSSRGRELREEGGRRDARWGLLMEESDDLDGDGDDASRAKWTWLEMMGNATSRSTAQFLVVTDGSERVQIALAAALASAGGAVAGYVPVASFVVVGTPTAAAAAMAVPGVLWVGPLTPADRTTRTWDFILPLLAQVYAARSGTAVGANGQVSWTNATARDAAMAAATSILSAGGIIVDASGRVMVEVVLPPLIMIGAASTKRRRNEEGGGGGVAMDVGVPALLAIAAAREFAAGVVAAALDEGAWARPVPASSKVLVGVRPEGLAAAVAWLGAHRAAHWVAPHLRLVSSNIGSNEANPI